MNLHLQILLLTALPMCLAQFSIQGPSDGNRVAQGLKVSEGKGIEYTDQNESQGAGDFTIQGATDGSTDFRIQGATDGHSDFQIQGPSGGGAARYNIQGATDGHSQSIIQGPYDANQGHTKSLQYNDPSGLRVNWRSYERQPRPSTQPEPQYSEPVAPVRVPQRTRHQQPQRGHAQQQRGRAQPQAQPSPPVYASYENTPPQIKQLLQYQAQIPYVNIIPEPFRFEALAAAQAQAQADQSQYREQPREEAPAPQYRTKARVPSRHRREAQQQKNQGAQQPQYRRIPQPPADPQVRYSTNLPSNLQQLLKFQTQIPYINVIPEQYRHDTESAARTQAQQVRAHYDNLARQPQPDRAGRHRRQAPQQQRGASHQPQYRRLSQPPVEQLPQYSGQVPGHLQQLLKFQSQIPYNIIANQIVYRPDKPYVPQAVQPAPAQAQYQGQEAYQAQPSAQAQAQYQGQQAYQPQPAAQAQYQGQQAYQPQPAAQAQYQGQQAYQPQPAQAQYRGQQAYQNQPSASAQSFLTRLPEFSQQYNEQSQYQLGYGQQDNVRPVTENQY